MMTVAQTAAAMVAAEVADQATIGVATDCDSLKPPTIDMAANGDTHPKRTSQKLSQKDPVT